MSSCSKALFLLFPLSFWLNCNAFALITNDFDGFVNGALNLDLKTSDFGREEKRVMESGDDELVEQVGDMKSIIITIKITSNS